MRRFYLDNLRWCAVLLVLAYHVCYLFNGLGIPGKVPNSESISLFDSFSALVYPWFMVLLFIAAGMSARFALENRTPKEFLKERAKKLLIPSTLGLFALHWVTGYLNIKMGGGLDYIPPFLLYPISALSGTGPLWFAQMLFLFSFAPVFLKKVDKEDKIGYCIGRVSPYISLPIVLIFLWFASKVGNLPVLTMYRFGIYFFAFLLGYFLFSQEKTIDFLAEKRFFLLIFAIAGGVFYFRRFGGTNFTAPSCLESFLTNFYDFSAVLALFGFFHRYFDRTNGFCTYMSRTSFGLYVLHYPVFLWIAYLLTTYFCLSAPANYFIVLTAGTALTFAAYELICRIPVFRFLVLGKSGRKD